MQKDAERIELLSVAEVAKEWKQSPASVYRKIASGELHAVRLGGETAALRVPRHELERIYEDAGARSSLAPVPAERGETSEPRQSSSSQLAGPEAA
jgi:Helix-turn-helix domain